MYKKDKTAFEQILKEAREVGNTPKTIDLFLKWLSTQLSPAQISEIFVTYYDIDNYLQNKKILSAPLLETLDLEKIASIRKMVMKSTSYRLKTEKCIKAIGYYYAWLSENQETINSQLEVPVFIKENKTKIIESIRESVGVQPAGAVREDTQNNNRIGEITDCKKNFSNWLKLKGKDQGYILVSQMDISKMNKMALANSIIQKDLYFVENPSALRMIQERLQRCGEFTNLDPRLKKQYKNTLEIYIEYKTEQHREQYNKIINKKTVCEGRLSKNEDIAQEELTQQIVQKLSKKEQHLEKEVMLSENEQYLSIILEEDFENGFRIDSSIDMARIRVFYNERFGKELQLTNESLIKVLEQIGSIRDRRIYRKQDRKQADLLKIIFDAVMKVFQNGASCVHLEAVYQKYQFDLADTLHIYSVEVLGEQLINMSRGEFRKEQMYLCYKNRQNNLAEDVRRLFEQSPVPMTYDDIMEKMWYVSLDKIKYILSNTKSIVYVAPKTYFYSLNLPVNQDEIRQISQLIHQVLEYRSHITDVELRRLIDETCPGVSINTAEFTTYGLQKCLGYILKDEYSFRGSIIWEKGKELSTARVFAEYCDDREQVTVEELKGLASDMKKDIYWEAVRDRMIRISEECLLRCDQVDFDIDKIDNILETLIDKPYVPLRDIGLFMHFPPLKIQWNAYVLESYIYKYSRKFKLLHTSFTISGVFGAVVRNNSGINDYTLLLVDVLANSNRWNDNESALRFLVEEGYQQRKNYGDIGKVVHEAKLQREKINKAKEWG